jgi:formylglycine-generating enzyme required for sulfatase activity
MTRFVFLIILFSLIMRPAWAADLPQPNGFDDHLKAAEVLFQQDKLAGAFAEIQAAGKADPSRYEAPALAALLLLKGGHPAEARTALDDARKLAPADKQGKLDAIAKLIDSAAPNTRAATGSAVAQPAAPDSTPTISSAQRRQFNVLMLVMDDADKASSIPDRQQLLGEFMDKSAGYVQDFPDDKRVWLLRALTCVELNRVDDGIMAARAIERLGLVDSEDPKVERLVANLDRKGWFKAKTLEEAGLGAKLTIPDLDLVLIRIDPGTFTMGSTPSETGRCNDEVPHQVTLTKRYWIGEYDVTVGEFRAFVNATGYRTEAETGDGMYVYTGSAWEKRAGASWQNPNLNQDDHHPVVGVSWNDAKAFCAWVNKTQTEAGRLPAGYEYTLPTEAQWEYACRSGTTEAYAGNLDSMGWYNQNSGNTTHPVGQKQPNAWGLYDMHGNVWEWCADWYGDYPGGNVTDPTGPSSGTNRVLRGGGWNFTAVDCRSACRFNDVPGLRGGNLGFRLALSSVR